MSSPWIEGLQMSQERQETLLQKSTAFQQVL
jgi:hypothetical protein